MTLFKTSKDFHQEDIVFITNELAKYKDEIAPYIYGFLKNNAEGFLNFIKKPLLNTNMKDYIGWISNRIRKRPKDTVAYILLIVWLVNARHKSEVIRTQEIYTELVAFLQGILNQSMLGRIEAVKESLSTRDKVILEMLSLGFNCDVLITLNVEDIFLQDGLLRLSDGRKTQMPNNLALLLARYLGESSSSCFAVFPGSSNYRISPEEVLKILEDIGERAGLPFKLTPRYFKNTYIANTKGLRLVSVNHIDLNDTNGYFKRSVSRRRRSRWLG